VLFILNDIDLDKSRYWIQ